MSRQDLEEELLEPASNTYAQLLRSRGFERVNAIRSGLSYSELELLQSAVLLSAAETARALGIPERTLARRKNDGRLTSEHGEVWSLDEQGMLTVAITDRIIGGTATAATLIYRRQP